MRTFDAAGTTQNNSQRLFDSDGQSLRLDAGLVYRRRFGRKGRAFVADLSYQNSDDGRNAHLMADNTFYPDGQPTTSSIRQRQKYNDAGENYGVALSYTVPLGKRQYLQVQASRHQPQQPVQLPRRRTGCLPRALCNAEFRVFHLGFWQ